MSDYFLQDGQYLDKLLRHDSRLHTSGRVVRWSLEQPCSLRNGDGWKTPDATHRQLRPLARLSAGAIHEADNVAVTESTDIYYSPTEFLSIPDSGFRLSDQCEPFGGWNVVRDACGACPANVQLDAATGIVGCHGHLGFQADLTGLLDYAMQQAIEEFGLQEQVDDLFSPAKQLWTRFWMTSIWRAKHAEVVYQIMSEIFVRVQMGPGLLRNGTNESLTRFLKALGRTRQQDIPLHVDLLPPFAADQNETYAHHCKFCKTAAPKDWYALSDEDSCSSGASQLQGQFTITCPNCEMPYDPTVSPYPIEQLQTDKGPQALESLLGHEDYWDFVVRSLVKDGHPEELARRYCQWERDRRSKNPKSWRERKHLRPAHEGPCYGPACQNCGEYLPNPNTTICLHCEAE